jgi:hypothetical protein
MPRQLCFRFACVVCFLCIASTTALRSQEPLPDSFQPVRDAMRAMDVEPPSDDVQELASFIQQINETQNQLSREYRALNAKLSKVRVDVANKILTEAESISDDAFYAAAQVGLATRLKSLPQATLGRTKRSRLRLAVKR